MVDTLSKSGFEPVRFGRANASGIAIRECAQEQALKIDFVNAGGLATQRDRLADEGFADGTESALPFDLSMVTDVTHGPTASVADGLRPAITPSAEMVAIGGIM